MGSELALRPPGIAKCLIRKQHQVSGVVGKADDEEGTESPDTSITVSSGVTSVNWV